MYIGPFRHRAVDPGLFARSHVPHKQLRTVRTVKALPILRKDDREVSWIADSPFCAARWFPQNELPGARPLRCQRHQISVERNRGIDHPKAVRRFPMADFLS